MSNPKKFVTFLKIIKNKTAKSDHEILNKIDFFQTAFMYIYNPKLKVKKCIIDFFEFHRL